MNNNSTYITEAPQAPTIDNPLPAYIGNIRSKLQHVNWKQNLILSYNYLPLANIKQKLQADHINYIKKMQAQQARLKELVDNQEITTLLRNLNSFKDKLQKNADKMQKQIISHRSIVNKLQNKVKYKRQILKNIKKIKIQRVRESLLQEGIKSARDIKYLMSSNTKTILNSNYNQLTSRLRAQSYTKISQKSNQQIFKECIKILQKNQYQRIEQNSSKNKKNGINDSNYSSVPNKKVHNENIQHKITLDEFMKLNKNQLIKIIQKEDPQFQALFSLLQ